MSRLTEDFLAALAAEAERKNPDTPLSQVFADSLNAYLDSTPANDADTEKD